MSFLIEKAEKRHWTEKPRGRESLLRGAHCRACRVSLVMTPDRLARLAPWPAWGIMLMEPGRFPLPLFYEAAASGACDALRPADCEAVRYDLQ